MKLSISKHAFDKYGSAKGMITPGGCCHCWCCCCFSTGSGDAGDVVIEA